MKKPRKYSYTKSIAEANEWLAKPSNSLVLNKRPREFLEKELEKPGRNSDHVVINSLDWLATWEGTRGVAFVDSGNKEGWQCLALCCYYRLMATCLRFSATKEGQPALFRDRESLCYAHSITLGLASFVDWAGSRVLDSLSKLGSPDKELEHFVLTPLNPFMVKLYCLRNKSGGVFPLGLSTPPVSVYDELVKVWEDDSAFGDAIRKACDYHCEKTVDDDKGTAEFIWSPYGVLPVEILAIKRIRAILGQDFPHIAHPLLETPFFSPPHVATVTLDGLIQRVKQMILNRFPELSQVLAIETFAAPS
jgi:hypothetical protein